MSSPGTESLVAETPDTLGAFPRLTPLQLQTLSEVGTTASVSEGQVLARAGEPLGSFFVVVEGRVMVHEEDPDLRQSDQESRRDEPGSAVVPRGSNSFRGRLDATDGPDETNGACAGSRRQVNGSNLKTPMDL